MKVSWATGYWELGTRLAADTSFQKSVQMYLTSFCEDTTQLAYGRNQVIDTARNAEQSMVSGQFIDGLWCGFSQISERFFSDQFGERQLTEFGEMDLLRRWLKLTLPVFCPTMVNRRVDIKDMTAFIKSYKDAKD